MQTEGPDTRDRAGSSRAVRSTLHEGPQHFVVVVDDISVRSTILTTSAPPFPISSSDQSFAFVSSLTLLPNAARGHLYIPSARAFFTPRICFAI